MSLIRGTKCSHDALEFGGAVVRLAYGGPVEEPLRERTLATLRLMDLPVPSSVGSGTLYEYARLYDQLMGVVGAVRARDRRERRRSVWRTLRALVLIVGLVFLFLALSNWLDRYFEYDVDKWLCVLLSALICGSAAMVVFFHRFVYRKVVAVTKWARLLVRKFEEDTRP